MQERSMQVSKSGSFGEVGEEEDAQGVRLIMCGRGSETEGKLLCQPTRS
jgi:hypothetical protein